MKKETYDLLERYLLSCMDNNAHDKELAESRRQSAVDFYENILSEVKPTYEKGRAYLANIIE